MEYTQNYALRKPGLNEYANVGDLNYNSDKIDSQMKKNQDVDGEVYDPTSTSANAYEAGDYVINPDDGLMYVCNGTTYGTWDATKWDHTTEFEEIQKAMASGGESELANLHDVEITNPTNGQALLYDDTTDKWHNSDLPDADVTKTASGNPIEFEDGADAPLVKCVTAITGSQDLHGQDKPWVGGAGVNKMPPLTNGTYTSNGLTVTVTDDSITVTGQYTTAQATWVDIPFVSAVTIPSGYYLHIRNSEVHANTVLDFDSQANILLNKQNRIVSISALTSCTNIRFFCNVNATEQFNLTMQLSIEQSNSVTDWTPYSNICPITAYTEGEIEVRGHNMIPPAYITHPNNTAIRAWHSDSGVDGTFLKAGTYTFFSDKGQANGLYVNKYENGTATTIFTKYNATYFTFTLTEDTDGISLYLYFTNGGADDYGMMLVRGEYSGDYEDYKCTTHTTTYPSAIYRGSEDVVKREVTSEYELVTFDGSSDEAWDGTTKVHGIAIPEKYRCNQIPIANEFEGVTPKTASYFYDGEIALTPSFAAMNLCMPYVQTTAEFKQWLSEHPLQVVFKVATPTAETVTPTNLPIKSLSGYNHIESSTGDMEIEYFPAKEQPLIDLIPEASNMHEYSTEEHAVGTWIDGETIYEQTYTYSGTGAANPFQTTIDMTGKNLIEVIPHYARYTYNSGQSYGECIGSELLYNSSSVLNIRYVDSVPYTLTVTSGLGSTDSYDIAFTLRYTKTSSNNRSLKSAPTEEVKEEQVEELKEEPSEEVKEEPVEEVKEEETKEIKEEPTEEAKEEPEEPVEELKEEPEEETKEPETNEEEAKR